MTNTKSDPARILAASLDANPAISAESIIQKFLVHWKLFTACALIVPLIAVSLSSLVPATYKSTAQLLIRVEGGSNVLYDGISPPIVALTGATTAEMIKSIPVASQMIQTVGVEDSDIARPAYKVLFGKAAALILPLLGREPTDQQLAANPKLKYAFLANELKPSVDATTLMMDHSTSSLRDELVNITVKANSREKVAAMVNGLCEAYIADYDLRSKNEIMTAYKTLGDQAAAAEADLARLRSAPARADVTPTVAPADNSNTNPLSAGLAHTISDLETQLVVLRQTYAESSVEVIQAVAELKRDRALLAREQALDATTGLLGNIKARQHQLLLAATLYDTGQSNLLIVERGLTPKATKLVTVMRYGIPGAGGLVGGMFIGAIAILLLNLLDPRLFVESDVSAASGRPVLGVIPASGVGPLNFAQLTDLPLAGARPALLQALGKLDLLDRDHSPVVVVTSAENESSTATVVLQLAALLARNREGSVLLADANFDHPALTEAGAVKNEPGLLDVLAGSSTAIEAARPTKLPRLAFIGTGRLNLRDETGSSREGWIRFLEYGRKNYSVVVIHAPGLLNSREAAPLAKNANQSLLVTNFQVSKKPCFAQASSLLAEIGAPVLGVIHCEIKP